MLRKHREYMSSWTEHDLRVIGKYYPYVVKCHIRVSSGVSFHDVSLRLLERTDGSFNRRFGFKLESVGLRFHTNERRHDVPKGNDLQGLGDGSEIPKITWKLQNDRTQTSSNSSL